MGLLESLRNIKFQPSAGSMGLLNAGAQMLANSGPSLKPQGFGQALGQGIGGFSEGFMGFQDREAEQQDALLKRQLLEAHIAAQDPEVQRQKMFNEAKIKAEIEQQYPRQDAAPSGFKWGANGSLEPIPVSGMGGIQNMPEYQMQLAQAKLNQQLGLAQAKDLNKTEQFEMSDGTKRIMTAREALAIQNGGQASAPSGLGIAPLANNDQIIAASQPKVQPSLGFGQSTVDKAFQTQSGKNTAEMQKDLLLRKQSLPKASAGIDAKLADIDRLILTQKRTLTGPFLGSPAVASARQSIPGGEDLQRIESGYGGLSMDKLIELKGEGATFGALSDSEQQWIKESTPQLGVDEDVNLELLEKRKKELQDRKRMLYQSAGVPMPENTGAASAGWGDITDQDKADYAEYLKGLGNGR